MDEKDISKSESSQPAKKAAKVGQWKTPPSQFFHAAAGGAAPGSIEYAALVEAYRRGAAAAVAMAQQGQAGASMNSIASCPDLAGVVVPPMMIPPPPMGFMNPPVGQPMASSVSVPAAAAAKPKPVQNSAPSSSTSIKPLPVIVTHPTTQQADDDNNNNNNNNNNVNRSVSMPDMNRYTTAAAAQQRQQIMMNAETKAQQEEEKRKKRLARNRASARLRRLKKKNLVENYEQEVGILEASLEKLKLHKWGSGNCDALLEALSMERGQQNLSEQERKNLVLDILKQQREQVATLRETQLESMALTWFAGLSETDIASFAEGSDEAILAKELNEILHLSNEQRQSLSSMQVSEDEQKAVETVDECLEAMMKNSWLMNHGVEELTEQFTSILNPSQISKFLIFCDANSEAIDTLDYVNAPSASAPPEQSPIFVFGTDVTEDDGK